MTEKEINKLHCFHSLIIDNETGLHFHYVSTERGYIIVNQGGFTTFAITMDKLLTDRFSCLL